MRIWRCYSELRRYYTFLFCIYVYIRACICTCDVCVCVCEWWGGQRTTSFESLLAVGAVTSNRVTILCCCAKVLTEFWGLELRSLSLHSKHFYPEANLQSPDTVLMLSQLWMKYQVEVRWASRVCLRETESPKKVLSSILLHRSRK